MVSDSHFPYETRRHTAGNRARGVSCRFPCTFCSTTEDGGTHHTLHTPPARFQPEIHVRRPGHRSRASSKSAGARSYRRLCATLGRCGPSTLSAVALNDSGPYTLQVRDRHGAEDLQGRVLQEFAPNRGIPQERAMCRSQTQHPFIVEVRYIQNQCCSIRTLPVPAVPNPSCILLRKSQSTRNS